MQRRLASRPARHYQRRSPRARGAAGSGSTGKNAGGFRHQFSNSANIELSIESIELMKDFESVVGTPIDFHQDGYLFLLSKSATLEPFKKNVALQQKHGVDVRWVTNEEARELSPGLDLTGVKGATYCPSDGVADPNGVTMGFAKGAQAQGVEIVRECEVTGARLERPPPHRGPHVEGRHLDADPDRRGGAVGEIDRALSRRRRAGRARASSHLHRVSAGRRIVGRRAACRPGADLEDPRHRFREHVLLPSRRRRAAVRHGRSRRAAGIRHHRRWDFLPKVIEVAMLRLPALSDAAVSHAWAGLYEMTPDHNPIIGPSSDVDGFYTIAGFSGHGFQHSPAAGRILADVIAGRDPKFDLSPFEL